jgi:AcrR family transcriptional regulator
MGAKTDRRHVQGAESREKILDAALEIAAARGYEGTSIAAVSKRSGLPASSIYWHFRNKDDLIAAVIQRSFDTWLRAAVQVGVRRPGVDIREHLVTSLREQAAALAESPEFLRLGLMLAIEERPEQPAARTLFLQIRAQTSEIVTKAMDRAIVEVTGHRDPDLAGRLATLIMAAADGLFIAHQIDRAGVRMDVEFALLAEMIIARIEAEVPR